MMRWLLFIPVCAFGVPTVLAQGVNTDAEIPLTPPAYKMLRFDEDYSCLTNQDNRADLFDPVKYIPLRKDDPLWYLSFGGELRERVEGNYDPNFGIGGVGSDSYLLQRITLSADVHLGERVRFFVEGISGIVVGESHTPPPVQQDEGDLQFAFVDVVPWLTEDQRLTLRVGRFGMSFGAGRLVATRAAPNIPFRFQGVEILYSRPAWNVTSFLTQPVKDSGGISSADHSTTFWGLYATHYFDAPRTTGLDLYYLGIHNDQATYASGTADEHRHSLGAREFGVWRHWDWDAEQVLQVGSFGSDSILAWTAAINAGYTWDTLWQPRLGIKTGIASGDHDPNNGRQETFDPLFFKSGYFNDASLIRPSNIIGVHPNLTLQLSKSISVDGGADWFWRYSRNDAVYGVPGQIAIPALSNAPSYIGTALDVNLNWQIQRHISFQASYVHFLTSSYVHDAGGKDVNYFSTTFTFLF
jgi:hypothetical protein